MGVTGLWTVVQPCARPIKLETLNKKRLAVDASIWIYQFLKAVRDKEGNALRNSHVVGFFRRICKLLFFGIKPVFVFDGGAPILKRQTVSGRKARREGRREDAVRTAGKLLAVQMQRRAEEDEIRRREERDRPGNNAEEEEIPEDAVYVDELQLTAQERQQTRTFKKRDAYHLPNLDMDLADMGAPNDPRIMSHEELEEYARQFHTGEDVNVYDFSKIDFESPFFLSLPASDRYNILNAARLRSRLRMGYSKEQLDTMFPNRMDFSRFQIERVKERNELTQRLMNINGMNGEDAMFGINDGGRVAGEKGKEYVLVKNDGVEGGWALGVVSNKGAGERNKPIDIEELDREEALVDDDEDGWEDEGFEDVPIEGLNRLLRRRHGAGATVDVPFDSEKLVKQRNKLYESRANAVGARKPEAAPADEEQGSLFVPQQENGDDEEDNMDDLFEDVPPPAATQGEDDEDLDRAIAMSLENHEDDRKLPSFSSAAVAGPRIDKPLEFNQKNAKAGRDFAHLANTRALGGAPNPFADDSDDEDFHLQTALEESRRTMHKSRRSSPSQEFKKPTGTSDKSSQSPALEAVSQPPLKPASPMNSSGFDGPLPFESLNLGKSILGRKKKRPPEEPSGGFERETPKQDQAQPLPPWFSGDIREENARQKAIEENQNEGADRDETQQSLADRAVLRRQETGEVIDLDAPKEMNDDIIDIASSEGGDDDFILENVKPMDSEIRMDDVADLARVEPPVSEELQHDRRPLNRDLAPKAGLTQESMSPAKAASDDLQADSDDEAAIDWSESEAEDGQTASRTKMDASKPAGGKLRQASKSQSPEIQVTRNESKLPTRSHASSVINDEASQPIISLPQGGSIESQDFQGLPENENDYSDPEDEALMQQLAVEAEEHARFASSMNQNSHLQNAEDYEKELRQLRNQQKKDRRDADEVTHIMITECQQLLRFFGLPYITAPMEAEAQCATLVSLGLVDGIVTDDSDVFLFGGTRVYKNLFNQSKYVECYLSSDLEKEYSLTREKLIRFAHLLGSDYTEGIPSVGPVTALEILSEFDTLEKFTEWWSSVQMGQKPPVDDNPSPFRRKFRKNATKIFLPTTFPDTRVDHAYLHPEVDSDPEPFQWGVPDLDSLRQFLMTTIGWSQERTDEVLVPVIKDMNRRENEGTQSNITQFFGGAVGAGAREGGAFAPRRRGEGKSKRMETALGRLHERAKGNKGRERGGEAEADAEAGDGGSDADGGDMGREKARKSRARKRAAPETEDGGGEEDGEKRKARVSKKARKKGTVAL